MTLMLRGEKRRVLSGAMAVALVTLAGCDRETPSSSANSAVEPEASGVAAIIRARQAYFRDMEARIGAIDRALSERPPSLRAMHQNARQIADYAPQILTWFPAGSDAAAGVATGAKTEIWLDQEGFGRAAAEFIAVAEEFDLAVRRGDATAVRETRPALTAACSACHTRFLSTASAR